MKSLPYLLDEHLIAIAHVAIRSAQLEHSIEIGVSALFGTQRATAKAILTESHSNKLVGLLRTLLLDIFRFETDGIEPMINRVHKARRRRNDVMHYVWGRADERGKALAVQVRPFREPKDLAMTAAEIGEVADELLAASIEVMEWTERGMDRVLPKSSPNRLLQQPQPLGLLSPSGLDQQEPLSEPSPQPPPSPK